MVKARLPLKAQVTRAELCRLFNDAGLTTRDGRPYNRQTMRAYLNARGLEPLPRSKPGGTCYYTLSQFKEALSDLYDSMVEVAERSAAMNRDAA